MSDAVVNVGDADFATVVLSSELPVLVDFWAEWCGPCKSIAPLLDDLARTYQGRIKVVKVNIDSHPQTPRQYAVRGIPTLMLFKGGKVAATQIGMINKPQLATFIEKNV